MYRGQKRQRRSSESLSSSSPEDQAVLSAQLIISGTVRAITDITATEMPRRPKNHAEKELRWHRLRNNPVQIQQAPGQSSSQPVAPGQSSDLPSSTPATRRRASTSRHAQGTTASEGFCMILGADNIWRTHRANIKNRLRCLSKLHISQTFASTLGYPLQAFRREEQKTQYRYKNGNAMRSSGTVTLSIRNLSGTVETIDAMVWVGKGVLFDIEVHKSIAVQYVDISTNSASTSPPTQPTQQLPRNSLQTNPTTSTRTDASSSTSTRDHPSCVPIPMTCPVSVQGSSEQAQHGIFADNGGLSQRQGPYGITCGLLSNEYDLNTITSSLKSDPERDQPGQLLNYNGDFQFRLTNNQFVWTPNECSQNYSASQGSEVDIASGRSICRDNQAIARVGEVRTSVADFLVTDTRAEETIHAQTPNQETRHLLDSSNGDYSFYDLLQDGNNLNGYGFV